ncbi:MAG: hypothetical protein ACUVX8_02725 [Candidatus Zipacnadales bacterium]
MRRVLGCLAVIVFSAPSYAAWIWLYNGEKYVMLPPEEGQPAWTSQPDTDGNGRPGPVIAGVNLRIENEEGQRVTRIRLGRTVRLIAVPELGGLETEPLTVRFHLTGIKGELELSPDPAIAEETLLGNAPPIFTAECTLPSEGGDDLAGDYEATVEIQVGGVKLASDRSAATRLRILGSRESIREKVKRKIAPSIRKAGREVRQFAEEVAADLEEWWALKKGPQIPGALKDVQPRQTLGMIDRLVNVQSSRLAADRTSLAPERAMALRSRSTPLRSLVVIPFDTPQEPLSANLFPIGYMALTGLRISDGVDLTSMLPGTGEEGVWVSRLLLAAEPRAANGLIHFEAADGTHFLTLPTEVEWFGRVLFPGETHLDVKRQPTPTSAGMVKVKLISAIPGGAVRVLFTLSLLPSELPATSALSETESG